MIKNVAKQSVVFIVAVIKYVQKEQKYIKNAT